MPMLNPPHPGLGLRDELDALDLSMTKAAEAMGISRQHLTKLASGEARITPEIALALEEVIGSTAEHWLRRQNSFDLSLVRQHRAEHAKKPKPAPV